MKSDAVCNVRVVFLMRLLEGLSNPNRVKLPGVVHKYYVFVVVPRNSRLMFGKVEMDLTGLLTHFI